MRLRSASKRERSKKYLRPHGIRELWRVASASLRRLSSTAFTPLKERRWTLIVPSSLHPAESAAVARRATTQQLKRMPRRNHKACHSAWRDGQDGRNRKELLLSTPSRLSSPSWLLSCDGGGADGRRSEERRVGKEG